MTKYVWLDKRTGKFSNSWTEDKWGFDEEKFVINASKMENWVLIKYEAFNRDGFEFSDLMRVA